MTGDRLQVTGYRLVLSTPHSQPAKRRATANSTHKEALTKKLCFIA
ncbi:hypothetical protein H6G36_02480 [Anabaena minutissima FACHB-250]|nr:hypothetical protein [Anabaena minutissima FACHB-250]